MRRHPGNSAGLGQAEQTEGTAAAAAAVAAVAPALEAAGPREAVASQQPLLPV